MLLEASADRDMQTVLLDHNMTAGFIFPSEECSRRAHYTGCSVRIVGRSLHHYPQIRIRSMYLGQGYNTHTCDHAAENDLVKYGMHSSAVLCHKYLTMSERHLKITPVAISTPWEITWKSPILSIYVRGR